MYNAGSIPKPARNMRRRGQIMVMTAIFLPALAAFLGLSVDVGMFYMTKRRAQVAADAGAMGGAHEIWRGNSTGFVTSSAKYDTKLNNFDDDASDVTVVVNHPPASGPRAGNANFVEVIVSQDVGTFFLRMINKTSTTVRARAVAGLMNDADYCVIALNPTERGALTINGTAALTAGCGVMVNSNDDRALIANGGACIYADPDGVGVAGDFVMNGTSNCIEPPPLAETPPVLDPLAYKTEPVIGAGVPPIATNLRITNALTDVLSVVLDPGIYLGGIDISGNVNVTFKAGLYILMGGGLKITGGGGGATVTGEGVTFYNTNGPGGWGEIDISGGVTLNLSAPTSGDYAGMLFWNDPAAPDREHTIAGNAGSVLVGALYFPSADLKYAGTSSVGSWQMIVADTIKITGNSAVGWDAASAVPIPTRKVTLVE